jgi:hypothetical protein
VTSMSKYTPTERARIFAESERLLRDPPARPEPTPPREVHVVLEDPIETWKREADEADAVREANRAELRRKSDERAAAFARQAQNNELAARVEALEARVDALEATLAAFANGTQVLGDAIENGMTRLDTKLVEFSRELSRRFAELRALDDVRRGKVIDMPSPLVRKERVN